MNQRLSSPLSQPDDTTTTESASSATSQKKRLGITPELNKGTKFICTPSAAQMFSVASLCTPDTSSVSTPVNALPSPRPTTSAIDEIESDAIIETAPPSTTTSPQKGQQVQTVVVNGRGPSSDSHDTSSTIGAGNAIGPNQNADAASAAVTPDASEAMDISETKASNVTLVGGGADADDDDDDDDEDDEDEDLEEGGEGQEGEEDDDDDEEEEEEEEDDDEDDEDDEDDVSIASRDVREENLERDAGTDVDNKAGRAHTSTMGEQDSSKVGVNAQAVADGEPPTVPKKRAKRKQREPSMDVSLPKGPPQLPTMRLSLKIDRFSLDKYMVDIPHMLHGRLEKEKHPWAEWYEQKQVRPPTQGAATSSIAGPSNGLPGLPQAESLGDLGPFAHLLHKYPVGEAANGMGGKPKKRRKRRKEVEEYDSNDPFVDDSELQIDEPTHSAKPVSKGFYVAIGDIELERLQKKQRGVNQAEVSPAAGSVMAGAGAGAGHHHGGGGGGGAGAGTGIVLSGNRTGGRDAPPSYLIHGTQLEVSNRMIQLRAEERGRSLSPSIPLEELQGDSIGLLDPSDDKKQAGSRNSPVKTEEEPASKKKTYPTKPVSKVLAAEFEHLRRLVAKEDFSVRSKFPMSLRPPLRKAARVALELGEYNENFFNYLPAIFPYNRFTMSKLVKREFFEDHVNLLKRKQDELYDDLKEAIQDALPACRAEYEEASKKWREAGGTGAVETNGGANGHSVAVIDVEGDEAMTTVGEGEQTQITTPSGDGGGGGGPIRRWRWTERMREDVFQIILLENGITELRIEKNKLENSAEVISELVMRKGAYKRMNDLFPEDENWTTTTAISKEFSMTKKKHDRQNHAMAEQAAAMAASSA